METHSDWKALDDQVTVAPQIRLADVADIAAAGYRVVMCNRPDAEDPGQPDWETIAAACRAQGLATHYVPQAGRDTTAYAVTRFAEVLSGAEGRVFAYCRSGTRCEILWTAAKAQLARDA